MAAGHISATVTRLSEYFAALLRTPVQHVKTDVNLLELGADSIMLVEAQRWLRDEMGCTIEVRQFFEELNTLDKIAAYVDATGAAKPVSDRPSEPASPPRSPLPLPQIPADYALLQSQLALTAEVIEAQNRTLIAALRAAKGA